MEARAECGAARAGRGWLRRRAMETPPRRASAGSGRDEAQGGPGRPAEEPLAEEDVLLLSEHLATVKLQHEEKVSGGPTAGIGCGQGQGARRR